MKRDKCQWARIEGHVTDLRQGTTLLRYLKSIEQNANLSSERTNGVQKPFQKRGKTCKAVRAGTNF